MMNRKRKQERGFTLLLAALVASIVLALGSSIFIIAKKQVTLSSLGRDSQFAFYAADTGAECALYWDIRFNTFGEDPPADPITCEGEPLTIELLAGNRAAAPYQLAFDMNLFANADGVVGNGDDGWYCVEVTISKNTSHPFTVIRSDGYSTSCTEKNTSPRALQRSVQLQY